MKPFWREQPLSVAEGQLIEVLKRCHHESTFRDNLSTLGLKLAGAGSGDYTRAVIGALSTLGGLHAPIKQTYNFLRLAEPEVSARYMLSIGGRIPGWGNSFVKGQPDPAWTEFDARLRVVAPDLWQRIDRVTKALSHKKLFPNPSTYTAAAAIVIGLPAELAAWLFVRSRLDAWTEVLAHGHLKGVSSWA